VEELAIVLVVELPEPTVVDGEGPVVVVVDAVVVVVVEAVVVVVDAVVVVVVEAGDRTAAISTASTNRCPDTAWPDTRIRTIVLAPVCGEMSYDALEGLWGPLRAIDPTVAQLEPPLPDTWTEAVPVGLPWI
jgi:hypothetical protein